MRIVIKSKRVRIVVALAFCAICLFVAIVTFYVSPRFVYALRVQAAELIAEEPSVSLHFRREPELAPSLGSGTSVAPMMVMDPCILADHEGHHLFYSTVFCQTDDGLTQFWRPEYGEQFNIKKLVTGISYAFSADRGNSWVIRKSPLLLPTSNGWDNYRVETAAALVRDNVLHLFYCADNKQLPARYQIGEVSLRLKAQPLSKTLLDESLALTRQRESPLLAADYRKTSFRNNIQEPSVVFRNGRFEVYFVGIQLTHPSDEMESLGQDISRIGMGRAILDKDLKLIEITSKPLVELANIIEVKALGDVLIAFTTLAASGPAHQGERIGYRTSRDGSHWSQVREVLTPRSGHFDNWACMSATFVEDQGDLVMYYTALEHSTARPNSRWAIAIGPDSWLFSTLGRAESPQFVPHRSTNKSETDSN